jgi:hypothetical protein
VISPSEGRYLHTGQHKDRMNPYTDIHDLSGIRTHDPSIRTSEDSSCVTPHGHCDRHQDAELQCIITNRTGLCYVSFGRTIAQAVSRWLPTAVARGRGRMRSCGICS